MRYPRTVERQLGIPVLTTIPELRKLRRLGHEHQGLDVVTMAKRKQRAAIPLESATEGDRQLLNSLWTSVASLTKKPDKRHILFTGLENGAGTTLMCACSAIGLVRNTRTTAALVEANVASPALASYLGLPNSPGLADVLDGSATMEQVTALMPECPGLTIVTAGEGTPSVGEFADARFHQTLTKLRDEHECLFIDAPPILTHPESRLLLELVDGVVLVVRARSTSKRAVADVERLLGEMNVPILGSILNRYRSDMPFGKD